jgi:hypothetical protein
MKGETSQNILSFYRKIKASRVLTSILFRQSSGRHGRLYREGGITRQAATTR